MALRENNFDLIRLFAALQVFLFHLLAHYEIVVQSRVLNFFLDLMRRFPGVPIFFIISGFLVFQSYVRNAENPRKYFRNRFLRVYPGLWVMVIIMSAILLIDLSSTAQGVKWKDFLIWFFCETTFFQFYTSPSLRFWGVGVPNGSLWTLTTEVQFYLIVPVIFWLVKKSSKLIFVLLPVFMWVHFFLSYEVGENNLHKLLQVSVINYLYFFLMGIILFLLRAKWEKLWVHKAWIWLSLYFITILTLKYFDIPSYFVHSLRTGLMQILLSVVVLSLAYSYTSLSRKLLRGYDLSYGIYIYHMIVMNYFIHRGYIGRLDIFFLTGFIVIVLAFMSWKFIEHPSLKLKTRFSRF